MPNRIIKESALISRQLANLSHAAERTFWRLTIVADDFGRFSADPVVVKARCYPLLADEIKSLQVKSWIDELVTFGLIKLYSVEHNLYGFFIKWEKHQQKRAVKSKFPDPLANDSNCNQLQANVLGNETEIEIENDLSSVNAPTTADPDEDPDPDHLTVKDLVDSWNDCFKDKLPQVEWPLSKTRHAKAAARLREHRNLEFWQTVFNNIGTSKFLLGANNGTWRCSLDFLIANDTNVIKIFEGSYNHEKNQTGSTYHR